MAKPDVFAVRAGRQHVSDLDLGIGDDHAVDEQQHELAALLKAGLGQAGLHPLAEPLQRCRDARKLLLTRSIAAELLFLAGQRLHPLLDVAPAPFVFIQRDDSPEIGVGEPFELLAQARLALPQRFPACEQFLRQPRSTMRACHGPGQRLRLGQHRPEIAPDQVIKLPGGCVARRAACGAVREGAVALAVAQVVEVPPVDCSGGAGQAAMTAVHQGAQQVLMRCVVPPSKGLVGRQLRLHLVELRLAYHGGHLAHEEPGFGRLGHGRAMGAADGVRRRARYVGGRYCVRWACTCPV